VDVTESKVYEKQLQQFNAELKRSNEDLEQFAYVASHDLQEPLRKIRAFGDRLTSKFGHELKSQGSDYVFRMQAAAARMQLLIEDLLTFSRVSRVEANFELLEMKPLLDEVLEDIDLMVNQKKAVVRVGKFPSFYGDRSQIKRLFQNLIGNSIKFHKVNEKPIIDISIKTIERAEAERETGVSVADTKFIRISVKDNGIGFDEKYAEKIFNIFQRLNGRTAYEGTGIGLAICRKIVTNHGGFISAKSIEDVGSEFIIILPKDLTPPK
jgi:light-regulated signal transduction histidine kinase (bacteriophytochrome)